jgi:hypothetical protein
MGHHISGLVARCGLLLAARPFSAVSIVAPLEQGFGLLLDEECPGVSPSGLPADFAAYAAGLSEAGPVAWVATDYFGGLGEQAAMAWNGGSVVLDYAVAPGGVINAALRAIGFVNVAHSHDEFEAIGLDWFRRNEDWATFARLGHADRHWETESAIHASRSWAVWQATSGGGRE